MKTLHLFFLFSFYLFVHSYAQVTPNVVWSKAYGGSKYDVAWAVQQGANDGYLLAGITYSHDSDVSGFHGGINDGWIIKVDDNGVLQWQKCLGGSQLEILNSIVTVATGFVLAGTTSSNDGDVSGNHGGNDAWVIATSSTGGILWQKCYGGSGFDAVSSMIQVKAGGYIFTGITASNNGDVSGNHGGDYDVWVVRIDATGHLLWQKCLGGSGNDQGASIAETPDNGFIVSGSTASNNGDVSGYHDSTDIWVMKLDATGSLEWQKCLGGSRTEGQSAALPTADGGYIVAGNTFSSDGDVSFNHGSGDAWLVKLTGSGAISWEKTYGGTGGDGGRSLIICQDGGYLFNGSTTSNDGDVSGLHIGFGTPDGWLMKTDSTGNLQWQKCVGGSNTDGFQTANCLQVSDSDFLVAGGTLSSDGDVTGYKGGGQSDFWLTKISIRTLGVTNTLLQQNKIVLSPNPATGILNIQNAAQNNYTLYAVTGALMRQGKIVQATQQIDISILPAGVYVLQLQNAAGERSNYRIVKE